ncbi:LysR family transcriptional regulator [Kiloniella laminariae]|uniref:LysR family transcriptional regulator n=1 Tax=Kiloniella laminariae TaxID=454162 RepID=A0ABT4LI88_9PROT|nr:LysR family transcriptional regulator [Kiloniella laminariae]MCZ4279717.1 LysR family transcriptional regulator [Kiloniella laminariae]
MDLQSLRTFKLVMDLGSITAAAEHLHTVQPNVTARIRKLEQDLGTALFQRAHRRLIPTHEAHELLGYANAMLSLEQAAMKAINPRDQGHIRLGFIDSQAGHLLPGVIRAYQQSYPEAEIVVDSGVSGYLNREVEDCRLDAAVVVDRRVRSRDQDNLITHKLFTEPLVYLAPRNVVSLEEALTLPIMVLVQEGGGYRNFAIDWYRSQDLVSPKVMEISTIDGIVACIRAGICASVLPLSIVESFELQSRVSRFALPGEDAEISIVLTHRPELKGDRRIGKLLQVLQGNS